MSMSLKAFYVIATLVCGGIHKDETDEIVWNQIVQNHELLAESIKVIVHNGDNIQSFLIEPRATLSILYREAELSGIILPGDDTVFWEHSGRLILDDPKFIISDVLPLISAASTDSIPRQITLNAITVDQITITVHINNPFEGTTWSFWTHGGITTDEVYQRVQDIGMMENTYQFMLRYTHNNGIFGYRINQSDPPELLIQSMDPFVNAHQLRLFVSPIPEGLLLFALIRDMSPNQEVSFWKYATFCRDYPWHSVCLKLSGIHEFSSSNLSNGVVSRRNEENGNGNWVHDIFVDNVPSWSGTLHLRYIPPSVEKLTLKGMNVSLNINELDQSRLQLVELELDFRNFDGINCKSLNKLCETRLREIRLPSAVYRCLVQRY